MFMAIVLIISASNSEDNSTRITLTQDYNKKDNSRNKRTMLEANLFFTFKCKWNTQLIEMSTPP